MLWNRSTRAVRRTVPGFCKNAGVSVCSHCCLYEASTTLYFALFSAAVIVNSRSLCVSRPALRSRSQTYRHCQQSCWQDVKVRFQLTFARVRGVGQCAEDERNLPWSNRLTELRHSRRFRLNSQFLSFVYWNNRYLFTDPCKIFKCTRWIFFFKVRQPIVGQGLLIVEVSRSHLDTPQSVRLFWTSYQPDTDLYHTTHDTHKRQTSMPPAGFEPTIVVSERPQAHALDRAATGIGTLGRQNVEFSNVRPGGT